MTCDAYGLTRMPSDVDRLDVVHYICREAMGGHDHLAPIDNPARVLDAGCGTGLWAHQLAERLPDAQVIGLDLAPSRSGPANYHFVRANLLWPLPFAPGAFDYVHQRLLVSGIPTELWPGEMRRLVEAVRPGGWIELYETGGSPLPAGPATRRIHELWERLSASLGLDLHAGIPMNLGHYLVEAGATDVATHRFDLPVGEWGGWVGWAMSTQYRIILENLAPRFRVALGMQPDEWAELVGAMLREFEEVQPTMRAYVAYGRRP